MRRAVAERLAHRDPLGVERVGDAAHGRLRALLVDVPAFEMFERRGVHGDERRMDDRPGIHQRAGERIAAILDHAGKRAADDAERVVLQPQRQHAGRQAFGADRDRHFEWPVLAGEPRQGAGLGERHIGAVAGIVSRPWRKCKSRTCRAAGTRPGRRPDAARARARCRAARSRAQGRGSVRHRARPRAMSFVTSESFASCRPRKSFTVIVPPAALCAFTASSSRRHSRTSWPASAMSPAAANEPLPPPRTAMRIRHDPARAARKCCTLPIALRGSASTNT